jgi:ATP-dependent DNA helicase RecG
LLYDGLEGEAAQTRLRLLTQTQDGFQIAETDLAMRGPGAFLGKEQHGFAALSLAQDVEVLQQAEEAATLLLQNPSDSPQAVALIQDAKARLMLLKTQIAAN